MTDNKKLPVYTARAACHWPDSNWELWDGPQMVAELLTREQAEGLARATEVCAWLKTDDVEEVKRQIAQLNHDVLEKVNIIVDFLNALDMEDRDAAFIKIKRLTEVCAVLGTDDVGDVKLMMDDARNCELISKIHDKLVMALGTDDVEEAERLRNNLTCLHMQVADYEAALGTSDLEEMRRMRELTDAMRSDYDDGTDHPGVTAYRDAWGAWDEEYTSDD